MRYGFYVLVLMVLSAVAISKIYGGSNSDIWGVALDEFLKVSHNDDGTLKSSVTKDILQTINVKAYGAEGDGITDDTAAFQNAISAARASRATVFIPIPPVAYKITGELVISGVDVVGEGASMSVSGFNDPQWPVFKPAAGKRLFKVGPRDATDVANGFADQATLMNVRIDLSDAPEGYTAIGSQYGVARRTLQNIRIVGVAGKVAAKNFTGIDYNVENFLKEIPFYNTFRNISILHVNNAVDLNAGGNARYDENLFEQVYIWNAYKFFSLAGQNNTIINSGAQSFTTDFNPAANSNHWMVKIFQGPSVSSYSNTFINFNIEAVGNTKGPYFIIPSTTTIINPRGMDKFSTPSYTRNYIQIVDNSGNLEGPQLVFPPTVVADGRVESGSISSRYWKQNLIPNGNLSNWQYGTSFNVPDNGMKVMAGFTALRGGAVSYQINQAVGGVTTLNRPSSAQLVVSDNSGGTTGFQIDLANYYPPNALRYMQKVNVGMLVFVSAAQWIADGVTVKIDDGVGESKEVAVLRYDGTQTLGELKQSAGTWHVISVNHEMNHNPKKLLLTFGLTNDGAHAGTGKIYIDSVWLYPGFYDAYSAWPLIQPPAAEALASPDLKNYLVNTAAWNPPSVVDKGLVSTVVAVTGAAPGDLAVASHDKLGSNNVVLTAFVQAPDAVRVILNNQTGGQLDIESGTIRVGVWKH